MLDLRVDGLPAHARGAEVEAFLERYGELVDVEVFRGDGDVFAFVLLADQTSGESAIRELDDTEFLRSGHYVRVGKRGGPSSHGLPVRSRDERPPVPRRAVAAAQPRGGCVD
ncbi:unnamed protein product, partial [Prorocentrum cordatum]